MPQMELVTRTPFPMPLTSALTLNSNEPTLDMYSMALTQAETQSQSNSKATQCTVGANDTYYNYDLSNPGAHPPPAEMWICTDTYFTWQRGAVKYFANGVPDGYF